MRGSAIGDRFSLANRGNYMEEFIIIDEEVSTPQSVLNSEESIIISELFDDSSLEQDCNLSVNTNNSAIPLSDCLVETESNQSKTDSDLNVQKLTEAEKLIEQNKAPHRVYSPEDNCLLVLNLFKKITEKQTTPQVKPQSESTTTTMPVVQDSKSLTGDSQVERKEKEERKIRLSGAGRKRYKYLIIKGYSHEEANLLAQRPIHTSVSPGVVGSKRRLSRENVTDRGEKLKRAKGVQDHQSSVKAGDREGKRDSKKGGNPQRPSDPFTQVKSSELKVDSSRNSDLNDQKVKLSGAGKKRYKKLIQKGYSLEKARLLAQKPINIIRRSSTGVRGYSGGTATKYPTTVNQLSEPDKKRYNYLKRKGYSPKEALRLAVRRITDKLSGKSTDVKELERRYRKSDTDKDRRPNRVKVEQEQTQSRAYYAEGTFSKRNEFKVSPKVSRPSTSRNPDQQLVEERLRYTSPENNSSWIRTSRLKSLVEVFEPPRAAPSNDRYTRFSREDRDRSRYSEQTYYPEEARSIPRESHKELIDKHKQREVRGSRKYDSDDDIIYVNTKPAKEVEKKSSFMKEAPPYLPPHRTNTTSGHDKGIEVGILSEFGNTSLTMAELSIIQDEILSKVVEQKTDVVKPKFLGTRIRPEGLVLTCADRATVDWLIDVTRRLRPWQGARLKAVEKTDLPSSQILIADFPNSRRDSSETILDFIKAQNGHLNIIDWRVIKRIPTDDTSVQLTLLVDHLSFETLKKAGFKINYKFGQVHLQLENSNRNNKKIDETSKYGSLKPTGSVQRSSRTETRPPRDMPSTSRIGQVKRNIDRPEFDQAHFRLENSNRNIEKIDESSKYGSLRPRGSVQRSSTTNIRPPRDMPAISRIGQVKSNIGRREFDQVHLRLENSNRNNKTMDESSKYDSLMPMGSVQRSSTTKTRPLRDMPSTSRIGQVKSNIDRREFSQGHLRLENSNRYNKKIDESSKYDSLRSIGSVQRSSTTKTRSPRDMPSTSRMRQVQRNIDRPEFRKSRSHETVTIRSERAADERRKFRDSWNSKERYM